MAGKPMHGDSGVESVTIAGLQGQCPQEQYLSGFVERAVEELVGPIKSRHDLTAPGFDSFRAQRGPLVMKLTRVGKKGLSCGMHVIELSPILR